MRRQVPITNWTSTMLSSLLSRFREKKDSFEDRLSVNSLTRLIQESSCTVTHENMPDFSNGNYKRRSSKLVDKNAKCWVVFERSYRYLWLLPACSKIARTIMSKLERLDCSHLFKPEYRSKLSTDYSLGERWYGIVEIQFVEMTGTVTTKQASVTTLHVSVVWAFLIK